MPGSSRDLKATEFTPKKKKELTGFSLFVQQNSRGVRSRMMAEAFESGKNGSISQSDVMKECSRLWKIQKEQSNVI